MVGLSDRRSNVLESATPREETPFHAIGVQERNTKPALVAVATLLCFA